jgi:hypothetical protein
VALVSERGFVAESLLGLVQFPEWAKGPAHIEENDIVLDEDRAESYLLDSPELTERLAFDLAALSLYKAQPDPQDALTFVRKYGLLWHDARAVGSGECRESLKEWGSAAGGLATAVIFYRHLHDALQLGSANTVREFLESLGFDFPEAQSDEQYLMATSVFLANLLDARLRDCRWTVVAEAPGEFRFVEKPPDLVVASYSHLALLISSKSEIKECPGCRRLFRPDTAKQKYHNAQCASAARWRRWKERQASSV